MIFSNLDGVKNVYGEAVNYIDPLNLNEIMNAVEKINNDQNYKDNLIDKGLLQLESMEKKDQYSKIFNIIKNYRKIKKTWEFDH